MPTRIKIDPFPPPFFVVPSDAFKKGTPKLSLLNLSKRDDIISATFFKNIVTTKFECQLKAAFTIPCNLVLRFVGKTKRLKIRDTMDSIYNSVFELFKSSNLY